MDVSYLTIFTSHTLMDGDVYIVSNLGFRILMCDRKLWIYTHYGIRYTRRDKGI